MTGIIDAFQLLFTPQAMMLMLTGTILGVTVFCATFWTAFFSIVF